jgi:hypothetical protein
MFSSLLALIGVVLELLILYRAFRSRSLREYPFFYAYVGCVLIVDVLSDLVFTFDRPAYQNLYWTTQLLTLVVGYGVILEVTRKGFEIYPGVERVSRSVVLGVFLAVFSYVGFKALTANNWSPASSMWELERDLRAVQALVLAGVLVLIVYYTIQIGRNLSGIILGYGLYTTFSIISNALRSYQGSRFHQTWLLIQPYTYFACLLIWTVALWSYQPNPVHERGLQLEVDYESLVGRTRGMLGAMRSLLERSARS